MNHSASMPQESEDTRQSRPATLARRQSPRLVAKSTCDLHGQCAAERHGSIVAQLFADYEPQTIPCNGRAALHRAGQCARTRRMTKATKPAPTVRTSDGGARGGRAGEDRPRAIERPAPQSAGPAGPRRASSGRGCRTKLLPLRPPADDDQRRRNGGRDRGDNPAVGRAVPRGIGASAGTDARGPCRAAAASEQPKPRRSTWRRGLQQLTTTIRGAITRTGTGRSVSATSTTTRTPGIRRVTTLAITAAYSGGVLRFVRRRASCGSSVSPRFADVYVDGYFAGRVDDYDGIFQALKLEAGAASHPDRGAGVRAARLRRPDRPGPEDHLPRDASAG